MAATAAITDERPVGELIRQWRERRRISQLDLSNQADISTRHLSYVETGRSKPSSTMILRLSDHLDVPLRERNRLLMAGGFAPVYTERPLNADQMSAVRAAIRQVLDGHRPFPALVVDRQWNLLDANDSVGLLTGGSAPDLLEAPTNVLRLSLHPDGMARRIVNLGEWRAHVLARLKRQAVVTADPDLKALHRELSAYPCDQPEPVVEIPSRGNVVVPLQVAVGEAVLSFVSITAVFGTPLDVTLDELAIESFYPADEATAAYLRQV